MKKEDILLHFPLEVFAQDYLEIRVIDFSITEKVIHTSKGECISKGLNLFVYTVFEKSYDKVSMKIDVL